MNRATETSWDPARTWVVVVGTLAWVHADAFPPFPQENRRDAALVDVFRERGVPAARVLYLRDAEATLPRIREEVAAHLARAVAGDTLFLYYCGHGSRHDGGATYFASYDADGDGVPGWDVASIVPTVQRHFRGDRAVLLADCCYSGALSEAVSRERGRIAFACLASSLSSELSTGNWTFTEEVLAALRGHAFADADGEGGITLRELADQIVASMAFAEDQIATFAIGGDFDASLVLAEGRPRPDRHVGRRVEVHSGDDWYAARIEDSRDGRLRVHYYGYEASDDEWVTEDRVRDRRRTSHPVGTAVEVKWKGEWYPARVLEEREGIHFIGYEGFAAAWNEWVSGRRIRVAG